MIVALSSAGEILLSLVQANTNTAVMKLFFTHLI